MKIEIDESILDFTLITCAFNKEIKFWTIRDVINLIKTVQARERRTEEPCCDSLEKWGVCQCESFRPEEAEEP